MSNDSDQAHFDGLERGDPSVDRRENTPRRRQVAAMLREGMTISAIATELGVSLPTVCHHARKVGHPPSVKFMKRYDWAEIQRFYDAGHTVSECQQRFGFARASWSEAVRRGDLTPRCRAIPLDVLLVAGPRRSRGHIKQRLFTSGLKERRCEVCGVSVWRGRAISLELHHRNGDGHDNRLVNLWLLCPNCHSQTDTWGGRNKARLAAARAVRDPYLRPRGSASSDDPPPV